MRLLSGLIACVLLCSGSVHARSPAATVEVPVTEPRIVIIEEGRKAAASSGPLLMEADEIHLSDPDGSVFGDHEAPHTLRNAVEAFRQALPADYRQLLMSEIGFQLKQPIASARSDTRNGDVAGFLFDRWVANDPKSRLAQEFDCLLSYDRGIQTFTALVRAAEYYSAPDSYEEIGNPLWIANYAAFSSANLALEACETLVALGRRSERIQEYTEERPLSVSWFEDEIDGSALDWMADILKHPIMQGRNLRCYKATIVNHTTGQAFISFMPLDSKLNDTPCSPITFEVGAHGGILRIVQGGLSTIRDDAKE